MYRTPRTKEQMRKQSENNERTMSKRKRIQPLKGYRHIQIWSITAFVCYLKTQEPQDLQKIQLHIRIHHYQMSNISCQYVRKNDLNIIPNIYMLQP